MAQSQSLMEHLWIVRKEHRSFEADLYRDHHGWELRFLSDGQWFASQHLSSRELAIVYAGFLQNALTSDGWRTS